MKNNEVYDFINAFMGTSTGNELNARVESGDGVTRKGSWYKINKDMTIAGHHVSKGDSIRRMANGRFEFGKRQTDTDHIKELGGKLSTRASSSRTVARMRESQPSAQQASARASARDRTGATGEAQQRLNRLQNIQPRNRTARENVRKEIARAQSEARSASRGAMMRRRRGMY